MSTYDDYFTNDDKPFAENLNDALLLSNVFDLTVPIELPRMFTNSAWVNSVSPRKAGVSIVTLDEQLSGISIGTDSDDNSILTATEDTAFGFYFYPNFNSFGKIKSLEWEGTGNITVDLYTSNNELIAEDISSGIISESSVHLRQLKPILIVMNMPNNSVLNSITVVMENKEQDRYGAEVGISDVTGLEDDLNNLNNTLNNMNNTKEDKTNKVTSIDNSNVHYPTTKAVKTQIDALSNRLDGLIKVNTFSFTIENWAGQSGRGVTISDLPYYEGYSALCILTGAFGVTLTSFSISFVSSIQYVSANISVWNTLESDTTHTIIVHGKIIYYPSSWDI